MSNPAIKALEDWAEIAGVINLGHAAVYVDSQGKLILSVHLPDRTAGPYLAWLKGKGRRFRTDRGRKGVSYRTRFTGSEAVRVLNQTYDRLRDPSLKERADLALRYWGTIQKPGIRLGVDHREERLAVLLDFETLKQFPGL